MGLTNGYPKIVCPMLTYKRKEITIASIRQLQKQTIPVHIILVGSCDEDAEAARETGVPFYYCLNKPFLQKCQFRVDKARELEPDYILCCGSDDWLSANWCEFMLSHFNDNTEFGAVFAIHHVNCCAHPLQVIRRIVYKGTKRHGEPAAPGRIWSKILLDRIDWRLHIDGKWQSGDRCYQKRAADDSVEKFLYTGNDIVHLSVKGGWLTDHKWQQIQNMPYNTWPEHPEQWLEQRFPGSVDILRELGKKG